MRNILLFFVLAFAASASFAQQAPSFTAVSMDGTTYSMDKLRGKVVVVNLWFINCPGCIEEIRQLNQIVDQYKGKDVVFLGLAASPKNALEGFLQKNPFSYTILPNAQMIIISKFGTPDASGNIEMPFPMHYVFDRDGKQLVKVQGVKGVEAVKTELAKQFPAGK